MKKKIITFFFLISTVITASGFKRPEVYNIDAGKNAYLHNNLGLQCTREKNYAGAIQEFRIAIALNPNAQATAVYYNNLGDAYMAVGFYKYAQECYEKSLKQYNLNLLYYQNLVKSFKAQKIINTKIKLYSNNQKNPLNIVMLGLLYIENGDTKRGIIKLDEFCMKEPMLLITPAVKNYIKELVEKN